MLAVLPFLFFIVLFIFIQKVLQSVRKPWDWRDTIALTAIFEGLLIIVLTVILSAFSVVIQSWLAVLWGVATILIFTLLICLLRRSKKKHLIIENKNTPSGLAILDKLLISLLILTVLIIGIIAIVAPPHDADSMAYHMGRVMHWIQNKSATPYTTPDSRHCWMPPWSSYTVTHLYLLFGGDRLSNLVQWFSMAATLIVISRIAGLLGADARGQILSAVFAATIPVGIYQASSALTDYVTAFWIICTAWLTTRALLNQAGKLEWITLGIIIGLGLMTKGTYIVYSLPFLIWFAISEFRRLGFLTWLKRGVLIIFIILCLTMPYWGYNLITFNSPFGTEEHIHLLSNQSYGIKPLLSNLIRNISYQLATPFQRFNKAISDTVIHIHSILHIDPSDPQLTYGKGHYSVGWLYPGNMSAPLHLSLIAVALIFLVYSRKLRKSSTATGIAIAGIAGFVLYSVLFKWQAAIRFFLPFYLIMAPVIGLWLSRKPMRRIAPAIALLMFAYAAPSVITCRWRPIIGWRPRTATESIFQLSRTDMYFRAMEDKRSESIPFLVETLHGHPTSGGNFIPPFFRLDFQFFHDGLSQGWQMSVTA